MELLVELILALTDALELGREHCSELRPELRAHEVDLRSAPAGELGGGLRTRGGDGVELGGGDATQRAEGDEPLEQRGEGHRGRRRPLHVGEHRDRVSMMWVVGTAIFVATISATQLLQAKRRALSSRFIITVRNRS